MREAQYAVHAEAELNHWWFVGRRKILRALVAELLPDSRDRVLVDVGCATGGNTAALSRDFQTVGIDLSHEAIGLARERFPECDFLCGEAPGDLDGVADKADLLLLTDVLEHVPDDFLLLSRLLAVVRPGAHMLLTVPADAALWSLHDESHGHYRRYDVERFARLWQGLPVTPLLVSHFNSRLYPGVRAVRSMTRLWGTAYGDACTDLRTPCRFVNCLLTQVLAGERNRLVAVLRGERQTGYRRGVSLMAVLRREPGKIAPRSKPADVAPDVFHPGAVQETEGDAARHLRHRQRPARSSLRVPDRQPMQVR